jgi:biotin carboxyl carrier protein
VVLESMKMEFVVRADEGGIVQKILVGSGRPVAAGDTLLAIRPGA